MNCWPSCVGTIKLEDILVEEMKGTAVAPKGDGVGMVMSDEEYEGEKVAVPFSKSGVVSPKGQVPAPGSVVTFSLARTRRHGKLVAVNMACVPMAGVVDTVKGSFGFIRPALPLSAPEPTTQAVVAAAAASALPPPAATAAPAADGAGVAVKGEDAADEASGGTVTGEPAAADGAGEEAAASDAPAADPAGGGEVSSGLASLSLLTEPNVFFPMSEQEAGVTLGVVDEVEFIVVVAPNGLCARSVKRTKEAPKRPEPTRWEPTRDPTRAQTRFARGPDEDGGRGFAAGRGRPLTPPAAGAAEE